MPKRRSTNKGPLAKFSYRYARPMLTADAVVLSKLDGKVKVLLIKRKNPPHQGSWALPGGYVNRNEPALDAAKRELAEETNLSGVKLTAIGFFDTPGRDPRGWTVSVVHVGFARPSKLKLVRPGDDACEVTFLSLHTKVRLAFDHNQILRHAASWLKSNPLSAVAKAAC